MPVARSSSPSSLIAGNPHPAPCSDDCGQAACSAGVSGVSVPVPSAISTRRPSHAADSMHLLHSPQSRSTRSAIPASGSRARASQ